MRRNVGLTWKRTSTWPGCRDVPARTAPAKLLAAAAKVIDQWSDGWYVFGAQAVILWGRPRLTADVDVTVRLRGPDAAGFCRAMEQVGFRLRVGDREAFSYAREFFLFCTGLQTCRWTSFWRARASRRFSYNEPSVWRSKV